MFNWSHFSPKNLRTKKITINFPRSLLRSFFSLEKKIFLSLLHIIISSRGCEREEKIWKFWKIHYITCARIYQWNFRHHNVDSRWIFECFSCFFCYRQIELTIKYRFFIIFNVSTHCAACLEKDLKTTRKEKIFVLFVFIKLSRRRFLLIFWLYEWW